jgi:hypothetical protein
MTKRPLAKDESAIKPPAQPKAPSVAPFATTIRDVFIRLWLSVSGVPELGLTARRPSEDAAAGARYGGVRDKGLDDLLAAAGGRLTPRVGTSGGAAAALDAGVTPKGCGRRTNPGGPSRRGLA